VKKQFDRQTDNRGKRGRLRLDPEREKKRYKGGTKGNYAVKLHEEKKKEMKKTEEF